jgi:hypothetical protein
VSGSRLILAAAATLLIAAGQPQPRLRPPFDPPPTSPESASRLPERPAVIEQPLPERIPIDLGPDAPTSGPPPQTIDLLADQELQRARRAQRRRECEERRQAGIIAGEILVCEDMERDDSQLYSGSRDAWLKDYAARTMGPSTPDVDNSGLPPGMFGITIIGCFIPPCPKDPALIIDVEAIPPPPAGSDAERVAMGQVPLEGDDAPLSDEDRRRKQAELVLPEVAEADLENRSP